MATGIRITFALFSCQVAKDLLPDRSVVAQHEEEEEEEQEGSGYRPAGTLMSCDDCAPLFLEHHPFP